jgi:hypothetical protein
MLGYLQQISSTTVPTNTTASGCTVNYGTCTVNSVGGECVSQSADCCEGVLTAGYWYVVVMWSFFILS